jgi:hypothetical protein
MEIPVLDNQEPEIATRSRGKSEVCGWERHLGDGVQAPALRSIAVDAYADR